MFSFSLEETLSHFRTVAQPRENADYKKRKQPAESSEIIPFYLHAASAEEVDEEQQKNTYQAAPGQFRLPV
jgi:hypothetical protein